MAVPTILDINNILDNLKIRLNKNIKNMINTKFITLRSLKNNFVLKNPRAMYEVKMQKFSSLVENLSNDLQKILLKKQTDFEKLGESYILKNPLSLIDNKKSKYDLLVNTLKLVNPLNILDKGYSLVKVDNKLIKSSKDLKLKDEINIKFSEGEIKAIVKEINNG